MSSIQAKQKGLLGVGAEFGVMLCLCGVDMALGFFLALEAAAKLLLSDNLWRKREKFCVAPVIQSLSLATYLLSIQWHRTHAVESTEDAEVVAAWKGICLSAN